MVEQLKPATPAEQKIVSHAFKWRSTEKLAIGAMPDAEPAARRAHHKAKQALREALDLAERTSMRGPG